MATVTQWFQASKKPAHIGNYDYRYESVSEVFNVYFNGSRFVIKDGSFANGYILSTGFGDQWRGQAEKPA